MRFFALPVAVLASLLIGADAKCDDKNIEPMHPSGAIVVDGSGTIEKSFMTIMEAVTHLNTKTTTAQTIFIYPGLYTEQVLISKLSGPLVLQGYTCDQTSHTRNRVTISQAKAQKDIPSSVTGDRNDLTATLRLKTDNVQVYNLNIENPTKKMSEGGQALALYAQCDKCGFYACSFNGYQDTVCANSGKQLFAKSHISGAVDFFFGRATVWIHSCYIETVGPGAIAANGRADAKSESIFVFDNAKVYGSGQQTNYLGRPWKPYSRVVWQYSDLSNVINPAGWQKWNGDNNTSNVQFKEYKNFGPGAILDKRVTFAEKLGAAVDITTVLGEKFSQEWYVNMKYLG